MNRGIRLQRGPRPRLRRWGAFVGLTMVGLLAGCSERDGSHADGRYRAMLTDVDSTAAVSRSGGFSRLDGITNDRHSRSCEIGGVTWSFNFNDEVGQVAAIDATLSKRLCVRGLNVLTSGSVRVWTLTSPGSNSRRAIPTPGWSVRGHLVVTEVIDHHPGEPDVDETLLSETVKGTFELLAFHASGDTVSLRDGTFEMQIEHYKYEWEP